VYKWNPSQQSLSTQQRHSRDVCELWRDGRHLQLDGFGVLSKMTALEGVW